jgi:hypothetical protein
MKQMDIKLSPARLERLFAYCDTDGRGPDCLLIVYRCTRTHSFPDCLFIAYRHTRHTHQAVARAPRTLVRILRHGRAEPDTSSLTVCS